MKVADSHVECSVMEPEILDGVLVVLVQTMAIVLTLCV